MTEAVKEKKTRKVYIECVTLRRVGLENRTASVGETVKLEKKVAQRLLDVGAIKVAL